MSNAAVVATSGRARWGRAILLMALTAAAGCGLVEPEPWDDRSEALERSRARWEAEGYTDYTYYLTRGCYCVVAGELHVTVVDGRVAAAEHVDGESPRPVDEEALQYVETVDDLFATVERAIENRAHSFEVDYHPDLGHPVRIDLDRIEDAIDDEITLTVRELAPL